jgi:hypothetical protein
MRTPLRLLVVASCLALPGLARAQEDAELTPEKVAAIRRDEQQAMSKVDAEYGNRKPSEMSQEERREAIQKQEAASASAMEKHGVSAKDYARYTARMTPEDNARAKAEEKRLEAQAAQAAAAKKPAEEEEVHVQQGFSDKDPVELEAEEGAEPVVDVGVPGEGQAEAGSVPVEGLGAGEGKPAKRTKKRSSR